MSINEKMTAIADNIREKTEGTDPLTLDAMADGINEVYEAGRKAGYDEFWDWVQDYGNREDYQNGFRGRGNEYIRPKYKVKIKNQSQPQYSIFTRCPNLKKIEKEYFDFSQYTPANGAAATGGNYHLFSRCLSLEYFEDIGVQAGGYYYTWGYDENLHTIEVMRCCEEGEYTQPFVGCTKLKNLTIEGVIGTNFGIKDCALSVESLKSIIIHLKDYAGTASEYTYTITFSKKAFETLEAEGSTSPNGNTWAEYIDDIKWNLVKA